MADIFISYSKKDAEQARLIASLLEAQGYSVWWDTSLETGDEFRQEITEQLDAAKAVVALWTENSVKSVWVNAEASRAQSDGKLVPLKARLLPGDQIPLPFSELHTTNFDNHEAVLAAVKTQLAKPPAPSAVWKKVRYEVLVWFGVACGVLTLLGNLDKYPSIVKWTHYIIEQWNQINFTFWKTLLPVHISALDANVLTLCILVTGSAIRSSFSKLSFRFASVSLIVALIIIAATFIPKIHEALDAEYKGIVETDFTNFKQDRVYDKCMQQAAGEAAKEDDCVLFEDLAPELGYVFSIYARIRGGASPEYFSFDSFYIISIILSILLIFILIVKAITGFKINISAMSRQLWTALSVVFMVLAIDYIGGIILEWIRSSLPSPN